MRILYFTQLFHPIVHGGGEYLFYSWAIELARKGHQVFVITQRFEGTQDTETKNGVTIFRVGQDISNPFSISFWTSISFTISAIIKGLQIISKHKIDLLHSNTYVPVFAAQLCSKIKKIPHIATIHDVYYTQKDFWKQWSSQKNISFSRLGKFIEKCVLKTNCVFHTVSEKSRQDIESTGISNKIHVIPNGIDPTKYRTSLEKNQLVFIGRLVFYKNIETILESFQIVIKKIPGIKLVIVGDGPMKKQLQLTAESIGIADNIQFTGIVSDEQKIRILAESKILLNPSLVEGFGIVVLEAFASKKPVIVSNVRPLSDLVTDSKDGYVVDAKNPKEWADRIIDLLSDTKKAQEMGQAGYNKMLENYTIPIVTEKLEHLYRNILD